MRLHRRHCRPQVYRYLYNTFGETISVRAPAQMRPAPTGSPTDRAAANAPQTIGASFAMKKIEARAV